MDCYRLVITKLPPYLSWHGLKDVIPTASPSSELATLHSALRKTASRLRMPEEIARRYGTACLASLSVIVWPACYVRITEVSEGERRASPVSKADFAELACDEWLRNCGGLTSLNVAQAATFHMLNIALHTDLSILQNFAHSALGRDQAAGIIVQEIDSWTKRVRLMPSILSPFADFGQFVPFRRQRKLRAQRLISI